MREATERIFTKAKNGLPIAVFAVGDRVRVAELHTDLGDKMLRNCVDRLIAVYNDKVTVRMIDEDLYWAERYFSLEKQPKVKG